MTTALSSGTKSHTVGVGNLKKVRLKLDRCLDERKISRYALAKAAGVGFPIIDRYYKNRVVRYDSDILSRIITALDCDVEDILESYSE